MADQRATAQENPSIWQRPAAPHALDGEQVLAALAGSRHGLSTAEATALAR